MKKSFIYGIPMALMLAALLLGCESPTSSDDDNGGSVPKYEEVSAVDVYSIAAAFDEGQNPVYVAADIVTGNEELIVPEGKTLDFVTNNKDLVAEGLGEYGKLILAGDIVLRDNANFIYIEGANQKLIATLDKISKYVEVITDEPARLEGYYPHKVGLNYTDNTKKIKTTVRNLVVIQDFKAPYNTEQFRLMAGSAAAFYDGYLAFSAPLNDGYLPPTIIDSVATYYAGLKVYILNSIKLGDTRVKFTGEGISSIPDFSDPFFPISAVSANKVADTSGQIVFGGGLEFDKSSIVLNEKIHLYVKGPLKVISTDTNSGDLVSGGSLEVYSAKFDENSAPVISSHYTAITGTLPNNFGNSVTFEGTVSINGPSTINKAVFQAPVTTGGLVTLVNGGQITLDAIGEVLGGIHLSPNTGISGVGTIAGPVTGDAEIWGILKTTGKFYTDNAVADVTHYAPAAPPLPWITMSKADVKDGVVSELFNVEGNLYIPADVGETVKFAKGLDLLGKLRSDIPVSFTGGTVTFHSNATIPADKVTFSNPTIIFDRYPVFSAPYSIPLAVKDVVISGTTSSGTVDIPIIDTVTGFGGNLLVSGSVTALNIGKVNEDGSITPPSVSFGNLTMDATQNVVPVTLYSDAAFNGAAILMGSWAAFKGEATFNGVGSFGANTGTLSFAKDVTFSDKIDIIDTNENITFVKGFTVTFGGLTNIEKGFIEANAVFNGDTTITEGSLGANAAFNGATTTFETAGTVSGNAVFTNAPNIKGDLLLSKSVTWGANYKETGTPFNPIPSGIRVYYSGAQQGLLQTPIAITYTAKRSVSEPAIYDETSKVEAILGGGTELTTLVYTNGLYAGSQGYGADSYVITLPSNVNVTGAIEAGSAAHVMLKGTANTVPSVKLAAAGELILADEKGFPSKVIKLTKAATTGTFGALADKTATIAFTDTSVTFTGNPKTTDLDFDVGNVTATNTITLAPNTEITLASGTIESFTYNTSLERADPLYTVRAGGASGEILFKATGANVNFVYNGITSTSTGMLSGSSAATSAFIGIVKEKRLTLSNVTLDIPIVGTLAFGTKSSLLLTSAALTTKDRGEDVARRKNGIILASDTSDNFLGNLYSGSSSIQIAGSVTAGSIGTTAANYITAEDKFSFGSIGTVWPPAETTLNALYAILEPIDIGATGGSVTIWQTGTGE
jgi:hypothetical protein